MRIAAIKAAANDDDDDSDVLVSSFKPLVLVDGGRGGIRKRIVRQPCDTYTPWLGRRKSQTRETGGDAK